MNSQSAASLEPGVLNPNVAWAMVFVDELARSGLRAVCIAPGSRSTPLALAFSAHPLIQVYRHLDERSAAFFALGVALAQDSPAALLCTSGTAAANFSPAVIEACQSRVPLLVLTADRPPELRHSGANQTIDQIKMYGDQVLWSVDVALPQRDAPPVVIRQLRTLAARAYAVANGLVKGAVHLNFPFRKPLQPSHEEMATWQAEKERLSAEASTTSRPFTAISRGMLTADPDQIEALAQLIEKSERGLIVCGPRCPGGDFAVAVSALAAASRYPLLADPLSGVRFGPRLGQHSVLGGYDTFLAGLAAEWPEPDLVIRFGNVPTSKSLNDYLDRIQAADRVHVSHDGVWSDDSHRLSHFLQGDPALTCRQVASMLVPRPDGAWIQQFRSLEASCWQAMDETLAGTYFDGAVVADLMAALGPDTLLFVGNSLPVRHVDQFGRPRTGPAAVFANRGASGIDGNLSTALGIAAASHQPLVALLGDITFYHDLNGLLAIKELGLKVTIVLINNNGGGIFHRLPIANFEPAFTELFITPHGLDFEPVVRMYGLDFHRVEDRFSFQQLLQPGGVMQRSRVIEVRTDSVTDQKRRLALMAEVRQRIKHSPEALL